LRAYQRQHPRTFSIINQTNQGKAAAINNGLRRMAKGSLVMVVDADSLLHPEALEKMVNHFRDKRIIAAASNVKIIPTKKLLGVAQKYEYLISYRMKRALNTLNTEYIVGGVGSTFRKSALLRVGGYDTDTMTEDIDLTVKLIRTFGNKYYRVHYAADALTYTEHVLSFRSLVKQRFRWKYGRMQTLIKNRVLFFNNAKKYDKKLTWLQLPYAVFGEAILLLEPFLIGYILYITLSFTDLSSMLSVYLIVTAFVVLMLSGEDSESFKSKLVLALTLPLAYFLMYILAAVEFIALIKSIARTRKLLRQEYNEGSWEHVERSGGAVSL
jgi:biofilm PGA synthesis N-glycosyltransferase PgaC